ncbi:hypothetical protein [Pseudonocardia cypriaca]|uniref:Uncharacterized protein n=1 Tax=Pseudonocardia cypriaca TaxID=882449 RepID=A0A543FSW0_9PSEU|nr:hypothetical protein [Pseudonocardia cypriaca]TQM36916.1 hypothetical protein FB388_4108 [Pseudonocardia cypriaca]
MRIGWRDGVAPPLVSAIVVAHIGYLVRGSVPFVQDSRGMAATGLVLGRAAVAIVDRGAFRGTWGAAAAAFAVASGARWRKLARTRLAGSRAGHSAH